MTADRSDDLNNIPRIRIEQNDVRRQTWLEVVFERSITTAADVATSVAEASTAVARRLTDRLRDEGDDAAQ